MHPLDAACSRWEAAQRLLVIAEMAFAEAVYMYLVRRGPDPSDRAAAGLYEARLQSAHALVELHLMLEECRRSIRIL
jgi:hypothetical protein